MAEWKKVAVSGSNISQFNNDSGYLVATGLPNSYATASVNGVELIASAETSSFSIVTGSANTGLTISGSISNDTITFDLANIPNSTLANSSMTFGSTVVNLGDTVSQINGLNVTGSFTGSFAGAATLDNAVTNGTGITAFTYNGSAAATVQVSGSDTLSSNAVTKWDGDSFVDSNITDNGTLVTVAVNTLFQGDITVEGTASFQETTNLTVADRFVLLASGSSTAGDGGIVVQQDTQGFGKAFAYDSNTNRWGFTSSYDAVSPTFVPDVFVGAVQTGTGQTAASDAPVYGGAGNGYGTIHVDTDDGEIWIYA